MNIEQTNPNFENFVAHCNQLVAERGRTIEVQEGRKYYRLVTYDASARAKGEYDCTAAYCFVDRTTGNILKSAGWKKPSPLVRGSIFDDHGGKRAVTEYGAVYLR